MLRGRLKTSSVNFLLDTHIVSSSFTRVERHRFLGFLFCNRVAEQFVTFPIGCLAHLRAIFPYLASTTFRKFNLRVLLPTKETFTHLGTRLGFLRVLV